MADSEDFLTLETLLQDRNNDEAVVITTNESEQQKTGDIVGKLYEKEEADDSNQVDDAQETTKEKVEKKDAKAEITEFSDDKYDDTKKEGDTKMKKTEIKEKVENSEVEELADEDEAIEEQIKEEEKLMDRYPMADSDDMLALQEVVQSPSMEVLREYTQDENFPEENMQEENQETQPSAAVGKSDVTNNKQEKLDDETQDEEAARKEQFSVADDADYEALEELMASPNVQDVEMIVDSSEQYSDGNNRVLDIIDFHSGKISSETEKDYYESESPEAGYGEHLDHTAAEKEDHDNEAEATIKFEEKLEKKFNMADRDDMLSLEQMIQDPNMEMTDVVQENGDNRPGDINGVLSIAASFLGDHNKEETRNVKELREEIQQLPNVARTPINEVNAEIQKDFEEGLREKRIDFTHPAEKLKEQQESDNSPFPEGLHPVNFEKMGHDDKMMLISLLHLDGLKVNKLPGTTTPILKPFKMQPNLLNSSPKDDFVDIMNLKGIRKCCLLPRDPGPCKNDRILQWHFDPMIGTCLPFFYGGCEGNRNRFDTIGECLRKCGPRDVSLESIPEPIPEPPTFKSAFSGLNSMVSNLVPGKILSLKEKMSPNQQKFIHKFIKSALKHITDIKPVQIGPMLPSLVLNKHIESANKDIPTPLKSVMFKWPILRMVFDKRNNRVPFSGRSEARAGPIRLPVEKFMRPGPRDFRRVNNEPEEHPFSDFRKRGRDFEDSRKGGRDWGDSRKSGRDWEDSRKGGRDWEDSRKGGRDWEDRMRNKDRKDRKRGRDREERFFKKNSKHFSPSFKKSYKMMSHHEDNRHQISSDPKNKVNLIQVFVNKPNTEAHSSPSHHHTMIKKQFSPEPQIKAPLPPAPPVNRNTPPQSFSPQALTFPHAKPPMPPPPMMPPQNIPMNHQVPLVHRPHPHMMPPNNGIHHQHNHQYPIRPPFPPPHYHHSHPLPPPNAQTHFHVHQPFMHHPPPPFFDHQKPWWMRFERPFYKAPQSNRNLPHIIPSTGYPQKDLRESEERNPPEEKVMVVTVPPGTDDDSEPHYACLLPVSTGKCKAFLEKFYFNTATGRCELFIYGGCGGNANNFDSKEECQATCTGTSPVPKLKETTTRPDDTIIITSPVYVPSGEEEKAKETKKSEGVEPRKEEKSGEVVKQTDEKSHVHDESVKVEPVSLLKSSRMEYIIIIAVMCFVGLAVIILVALAVVSFLRKSNTSKKERVLEAVLSSHLEGRSIGSLTPRSHYYGQPPTETGPPPISDVPKIHKESFNEQL